MEILEKIKKELAEFEKKRQELVKQLRTEFPTMIKPLFEESKKIESIGWSQYTPYSNDGDECVFGVNNDELYINGEYEDELSWIDWRLKYYLKGDKEYQNILEENTELDLEEYKNVLKFKEVLHSIPEEFYKDLFGDHVKVSISKDGTIDVEDYGHD